jgi:hypothetical protein
VPLSFSMLFSSSCCKQDVPIRAKVSFSVTSSEKKKRC